MPLLSSHRKIGKPDRAGMPDLFPGGALVNHAGQVDGNPACQKEPVSQHAAQHPRIPFALNQQHKHRQDARNGKGCIEGDKELVIEFIVRKELVLSIQNVK